MGGAKRKIKADGDTWSVRLAERPEAGATRTVLFFCVTTDQRPYRVAQVPGDRIPDASTLERLSDAELEELFAASRSMDFPRGYERYAAGGS